MIKRMNLTIYEKKKTCNKFNHKINKILKNFNKINNRKY